MPASPVAFASEYVGQHYLMPLGMQNGAAASRAKKPEPAEADANPRWSELSSSQQNALAPLASVWDTMSELRKRRWLYIGGKFPRLASAEQERLHRRMQKWAGLTPQQRREARSAYARAKKLNREQKSALWQEYQQLTGSEKLQPDAHHAVKNRVARLPRRSPDGNASVPPIQSVPAHLLQDALRPGAAGLHLFHHGGEQR
jgi:hypothetical protein